MLLNVNEYHENFRLLAAIEDEDRRPFLDAVRAYAHAETRQQQVRLIEVVIRTSRLLGEDDSPMHDDVRQALALIFRRYQAFMSQPTGLPSTYREARATIKGLFF